MVNDDENTNLTFLQVSDGLVELSQKVWWKYEYGPMQVLAYNDRHNIRYFPELYSIKKPAPYPMPFTYPEEEE
jgi:hypothetical protein